MRENINILWR